MFNINILIVDDDKDMRLLLATHLKNEGYEEIYFAENAKKASELLNLEDENDKKDFDLIILDIFLNDVNGLELCSKIKELEKYKDLPIIIITAKDDEEYLKNAFNAGAHDYIKKPINKVEFLARVKAALSFRKEMKKRKAREEELIEISQKLSKANKKLEKMASVDGLTGLANRRLFDKAIKKEFKRAKREENNISLIMADIDNFKDYNDTYGHQAGDDCLKKIAKVLKKSTKRPADLAARYGGEEFAIILPATDKQGAIKLAEEIRKKVISLKLEHKESDVSDYVTISFGVNSTKPHNKVDEESIEKFIENADKALYEAKENGRNRVIAN